VCTLRGHSNEVLSVAYSPDGKHIASASRDETVKIWDSTTGKEVSVLVCHRPFICCRVECSDLRVWAMSRSAR
jgi:WD40 repeat protein